METICSRREVTKLSYITLLLMSSKAMMNGLASSQPTNQVLFTTCPSRQPLVSAWVWSSRIAYPSALALLVHINRHIRKQNETRHWCPIQYSSPS